MDWLTGILESETVRQAGAALVSAALMFGVAYMRELSARMAAQAGAMHAEEVGRITGARGPEKMNMAVVHAQQRLGALSPRRKKLERIIEEQLPDARQSLMPPANGH